jgi:hypothetical protein
MGDVRSFKKPLLYALVVSVVLGAILGIVLILRNSWGWFEIRVMLTTVIIAVASLCGLACELSKLPFGVNLLPRAGLILTLISAVMLLLGMWPEIDNEAYWKATVTVSIFAVATVHVCLLSIARLAGRFRWVSFIGYQLIYGLAVILAIALIGEIDSEGMWRFIAALSIVVAAITLVIPILQRIGRMDSRQQDLLMPIDQRNVASIDAEISRLQQQIDKLQQVKTAIIESQGAAAVPQQTS